MSAQEHFGHMTNVGSLLDGISLLTVTVAMLAVLIAFYCTHFLKQPSEQQGMITDHKLFGALKSTHRANDGNEGEEDDNDDDNGDRSGSEQERQSHDISDAEKKEVNSSDENSDLEMERDGGLVGKLKSARLKELEAQLTRDQLEEERRIEREQLAAIFELLKKQEEELNMKEIDETELNAQLNLYR